MNIRGQIYRIGGLRTQTACLYVFIILSFFTTLDSFAQQQATVSVSIVFRPLQSISINPSQKSVVLEYNKMSDYIDGVESTQEDHLTIYSTSPYEVHVKAMDRHIHQRNGQEHLDLSHLNIRALLPETNNEGISVFTAGLSDEAQHIISSSMPSRGTSYGISYHGIGSVLLLERMNQINGPTSFITEVVYTVTVK